MISILQLFMSYLKSYHHCHHHACCHVLCYLGLLYPETLQVPSRDANLLLVLINMLIVDNFFQQTPKEPVIFKKCGSFQDFERSLPNLCSHDSSRNKEGFGKNSSFNDSLDLVVANSVTISSNGIPHNKGSQDSQMSDQNSGVNSSPISFNLTGNNNVHLCKEYSFVDTHVLKEKDFPVEQKNKMVLHKTSNKESFKTPLRTFYRRARERIDVSEGQVLNNLNVGEGEGSASNQNEDLDANCKRKGFTDQSEAPFPVNGNTNSNLSSLNASGKLMVHMPFNAQHHQTFLKMSIPFLFQSSFSLFLSLFILIKCHFLQFLLLLLIDWVYCYLINSFISPNLG